VWLDEAVSSVQELALVDSTFSNSPLPSPSSSVTSYFSPESSVTIPPLSDPPLDGTNSTQNLSKPEPQSKSKGLQKKPIKTIKKISPVKKPVSFDYTAPFYSAPANTTSHPQVPAKTPSYSSSTSHFPSHHYPYPSQQQSQFSVQQQHQTQQRGTRQPLLPYPPGLWPPHDGNRNRITPTTSPTLYYPPQAQHYSPYVPPPSASSYPYSYPSSQTHQHQGQQHLHMQQQEQQQHFSSSSHHLPERSSSFGHPTPTLHTSHPQHPTSPPIYSHYSSSSSTILSNPHGYYMSPSRYTMGYN